MKSSQKHDPGEQDRGSGVLVRIGSLQLNGPHETNRHIFIRTLGNAPFIGKSCVFVDIPDETSFILDCGGSADHGNVSLQVKKEFNHDGRGSVPMNADFCVITHSHADHSAGWRLLGDMPIFSTAITRELTSETIRSVCYYQRVYPVPGKSVYFVLTPAGHTPGAAIVTVVTEHMTLVYTGDWKLQGDFLLSGAAFPPEAVGCDVLITEATFAQLLAAPELYSQLLHFQEVSRLAQLGIPAIHPAMSSGQAQQMAAQLGHFGSRLGQSGYEIAAGQLLQASQVFIRGQQHEINPFRGLFIRDVYKPYKQFVGNTIRMKGEPGAVTPCGDGEGDGQRKEDTQENIEFQERRIVVTAPQKVVGATTLDLFFETAENPYALFVFSGILSPGSLQWRLHQGLIKTARRDNMRQDARIRLKTAQTSYSTHCDFGEIARVLLKLRPKTVVGTHCSRLGNLVVLEELTANLLPGSKPGTLAQAPITLAFPSGLETSPETQRQNKILRIKLPVPLQLALDRLAAAGIPTRLWKGWRKAGNMLLNEQYILLADSPLRYRPALTAIGLDVGRLLDLTK